QLMRLAQVSRALSRTGRDRVARATADAQRYGAALALLNPMAVLERGYSLVAGAAGAIVTDAAQLHMGDAVALTFAKGRAAATLTSVEPVVPDQVLPTRGTQKH